MGVNTELKAVDQLLTDGVAEVVIKKELKEKLLSGKKLRIKLGIDPTGFDLHLGHMVVVHKLKEFQDLGHQVVLVFGNFTGQIGDPSGKSEARPLRTQEELEKNAEHYLKQVSLVLDVKSIEVRWNADWLGPLNFSDVVGLASSFTVAQMLERDMYQERIKANKPISLHEFFYPLMQGYDSVALKADVELGGTDQTFNLLAGREIQRAYGQVPQSILTVPILVGTDGSMKMGKTTGNYIGVDENAEDIYGKVMSVPDSILLDYFELGARLRGKELADVKKRLKSGENPRDLKMECAKIITELYKGKKEAERAEEHFKNVFQRGNLPEEIEEVSLKGKSWNVVDLLIELNLVSSKSDARRLIEGGGVKWDEKKVESHEESCTLTKSATLIQVGKRKFLRVLLRP